MYKKEWVSDKQAISLMVLFLIGEASIYIQGIVAGKDIWLSMLLAMLAAVPFFIMFARLGTLFPDKNLFDVVEYCFGKFIGKLLLLLFTWFAFHSLSLLFEDMAFFMNSVLFLETPRVVTASAFAVISVYVVKQGIEVFGRWAEMLVLVPIVLIVVMFLLLIPKIDIHNLLPIAYNGAKPILEGAFLSLGFPFLYVIGFLMTFTFSAKKNSPYKIYLISLVVGGVLLTVIYTTVILVLSDSCAESFYYPSYIMVSRISIGNFLQRLDIIAAIIYLIGMYVQSSVFLLASCKGVAKLFACNDYRFIVWPVAIAAVDLAAYETANIMEFFEFAIDLWPYYAVPFEIILPVLVWVVAEIKYRKMKKQKNDNNNMRFSASGKQA